MSITNRLDARRGQAERLELGGCLAELHGQQAPLGLEALSIVVSFSAHQAKGKG